MLLDILHIFQYYIRNFIQNRIRTLYKTIYNIKDNPSGELLESDDLMLQMEREVTDWMKNRSTEIEDLKKLEHYRREFLGNVSHELKTPIFNIQGYITTLLDGGLEDETINRNYLQLVVHHRTQLTHFHLNRLQTYFQTYLLLYRY